MPPQESFNKQIKGLQPLVDRRKFGQPFVVDGENFYVDANGPKSGLGRSLLSYKTIDSPQNIQTFKISETLESIVATNEGFYRLDTTSGALYPMFIFPVAITTTYPWSMAAVGNYYYFARKGSDLIQYDIVNDIWTTLTGGSLPTNIYSCCQSDGRLILLTDIWISWSAIGDGTDHTASIYTGAGQQALTKLGLSNPQPMGVHTVADGFLTFLSSGIIKSKSILATIPYRHVSLSYKHKVVNPYCMAINMDDNIIFLTPLGLFLTEGTSVTPWQPLMGEYFHTTVIPSLDVINNQNNIQLNFDYDRGWFSIWIAESQQDYTYTKAFLLNTQVNEWGVLNDTFMCLTNFFTLPTQIEGFIFGLIDVEGSLFIFDSSMGIEYVPTLTDGHSWWFEFSEYDAVINDSILIAPCRGQFDFRSKAEFSSSGVYYRYTETIDYADPADRSSTDRATILDTTTLVFSCETTMALGVVNLNTALLDQQLQSLDSYVLIGPYRILNNKDNDRFSHIQNIAVGTLSHIVDSNISDDWGSLTLYPLEVTVDWMLLSGNIDWNASGGAYVNYSIDIIPTLDAFTPISDMAPNLVALNTDTDTDYYVGESIGIDHLIKISALDTSQFYYVETLDVSGRLGGRL